MLVALPLSQSGNSLCKQQAFGDERQRTTIQAEGHCTKKTKGQLLGQDFPDREPVQPASVVYAVTCTSYTLVRSTVPEKRTARVVALGTSGQQPADCAAVAFRNTWGVGEQEFKAMTSELDKMFTGVLTHACLSAADCKVQLRTAISIMDLI